MKNWKPFDDIDPSWRGARSFQRRRELPFRDSCNDRKQCKTVADTQESPSPVTRRINHPQRFEITVQMPRRVCAGEDSSRTEHSAPRRRIAPRPPCHARFLLPEWYQAAAPAERVGAPRWPAVAPSPPTRDSCVPSCPSSGNRANLHVRNSSQNSNPAQSTKRRRRQHDDARYNTNNAAKRSRHSSVKNEAQARLYSDGQEATHWRASLALSTGGVHVDFGNLHPT